MTFERDGAQLFAGAALGALPEIEAALAHLPADRAGLRLTGLAGLKAVLDPSGAVGGVAASVLELDCRAVRAILFDKNPAANWSLGWHQDRTIAVAERREVAGFGPWSIKQGLHHVAPPPEVLVGIVTLRVHLDDVPETNGPLLIAPGSHRRGRVPEAEVQTVVRQCGTAACTALAGDVWLYATLILHASEAPIAPASRRVLQIDYAARALPGGLQWLGV